MGHPMSPNKPSERTLGQLQREFPPCVAKLILHIYDSGYECTFSEAYVGDTDGRDGDYDGPHRKDGGHYKRLAVDLNVFKDGKWLSKGSEPIWDSLGRFWKASHVHARWTPTDPNHFGFIHNGVF